MKKTKIIYFLLLFPLLFLNSCGSSSVDKSSNKDSDRILYSDEYKMVYDVSYDISSKEFLTISSNIKDYATQNGGYVDESHKYKTKEYYCYKIPTTKLDYFIEYIDSLECEKDKEVNSKNVKNSYNYYEEKIKVLEERKTIYEKELKNDTLSASEKINITKTIDDINYQIFEYNKEISNMDDEINYSIVKVNVSESRSFLEKTCEIMIKLATFIGIALMISIPFGVIALIIFIVVTRKYKKKAW